MFPGIRRWPCTFRSLSLIHIYYLRAHEEARMAYAALKRALAARYPYDIEGYCDGKEAFVRELECRALAECRAALWEEL